MVLALYLEGLQIQRLLVRRLHLKVGLAASNDHDWETTLTIWVFRLVLHNNQAYAEVFYETPCHTLSRNKIEQCLLDLYRGEAGWRFPVLLWYAVFHRNVWLGIHAGYHTVCHFPGSDWLCCCALYDHISCRPLMWERQDANLRSNIISFLEQG